MIIFDFVKNVRFQAVFFVFILMMPLVFTLITKLGDTGDVYELTVNSAEEEQRDERESEKERERDDVEEFIIHNQHNFIPLRGEDFQYIAKSNGFVSISRDMLTPPPEFLQKLSV